MPKQEILCLFVALLRGLFDETTIDRSASDHSFDDPQGDSASVIQFEGDHASVRMGRRYAARL